MNLTVLEDCGYLSRVRTSTILLSEEAIAYMEEAIADMREKVNEGEGCQSCINWMNLILSNIDPEENIESEEDEDE